jgi:hypothetical protein
MKTVNIDKFLGLRNTGQSRRLPLGSLETAQNIDIDDEGGILSRFGFAQALVGTSITAAYAPTHRNHAYIVDDGILYKLDESLHKTSLGSVSSDVTHWAEVGNKVFMSTGYIIDDETLIPWAVETPVSIICHAIPGSLRAGVYQVTATTTAADGRESASCGVVSLSLQDGQGVQISNATGKNIYITEANGQVFYFAGDSIGNITNIGNLFEPLEPDLLQNQSVPDGVEHIAYYDTCAWVSVYDAEHDISYVFYSKPYRWHVFDWYEDRLQVPGHVKLLVGTPTVLVIGTDKAIYLYNDDSLQKVANYGVQDGWNWAKSEDGYVLINTQKGVCTVEPFKNLTEDKVSLPPGNVCSTAIVEQRGMNQFFVLTDGEGTAPNAF